MDGYLALMFCNQQDLRSYAPDVMEVIQRVAGTSFKRGASAAGMTAIAFRSDKDEATIKKAFQDLWRPEQRTWVLPLDRPVLIDQALMEWVRKE
jgi:hypothetical protein